MKNEKRCPFKMAGNIHPGYCAKSECMIWCSYSQSCAISTIADILADSTICNSYFVQTSEEVRDEEADLCG